LVQNVGEPTGAFGCGRCILKGRRLKMFSMFNIR
jgi:hypothetical protein